MNELQQSLLESFDLLANATVSKAQNALTIEAEIVDIEDIGLNTYKISYMGYTFIAHTSTQTVRYKPKDKVYVLIPNGDFSKTKIIISTVNPSGTVFSPVADNVTYHINKSTNLLQNIGDIKLCSHRGETKDYTLDHTVKTELKEYLKDYKTLLLSFKVKTSIIKEQQKKGNYGLTIKLPYYDEQYITKEDTKKKETKKITFFKEYTFDTANMLGNVYDFQTYAQQNFYITVDDNYDFNRLPQFTAFCKNFLLQVPNMEDDIFITDISLTVIDILNDSDKTGYYLSIVADKGSLFLQNDTQMKKKLTPILKLNGKDTDFSNLPCYWFAEDGSITAESKEYSAYGGNGWKCLNQYTEDIDENTGEAIYQWVTNKYEYLVPIEEVGGKRKYKCVLINKDEVVISGEIEIKNLAFNVQIELTTNTGSTQFSTVGNIHLLMKVKNLEEGTDGNFLYHWSRYDKEGKYIEGDFYTVLQQNEIFENGFITEIEIPASLINTLNTIKCLVKQKIVIDGVYVEKYIGEASINITTSKTLSDFTAFIENGDKLYKYDADGRTPMLGTTTGTRTAAIKAIEPLSYKIVKKDGTELSEDEYAFCETTWIVPKQSMMIVNKNYTLTKEDDFYYYYSGKGRLNLPYTIKENFDFKVNDDKEILLQVKLHNGIIISASTAIRFLKDGQNGTNGSKYGAEILAVNEYDKEYDNIILCLSSSWNGNWDCYDTESKDRIFPQGQLPIFKVNVYEEGKRLNSTDYTVEWKMFDEYSTKPIFSCVKAENSLLGCLEEKDSSYDYFSLFSENGDIGRCNIVQAIITIKGKEKIFAYYPLQLVQGFFTEEMSGDNIAVTIPFIANGYGEVLYASDGTNPKYNDPVFNIEDCYIREDNINNSLGFDYFWQINENFQAKEEEQSSPLCSIRPIDKYTNQNNKNYIKVSLNSNYDIIQSKINSLKEQLDIKNIEVLNLTEQLEKYNCIAESIVLEDLYEELEKSKNWLKYRSLCISNLKDSLKQLTTKEVIDNPIITDIVNSRIELINSNILLSFYVFGQKDSSVLPDINSDEIKITISSEQKKQLKSSLSPVSYNTIIELIEAYNDYIKKYNINYSLLIKDEKGKNSYLAFIEYLQNILINEDVISISDIYSYLYELLFTGKYITFIDIKYTYLNIIINNFSDVFTITEDSTTIATYKKSIVDKNLESQTSEKELLEQNLLYYQERLNNADVVTYCIKPILMLYNRYELSDINDWDGNRIYTGEKEEFLYAPQIGAGRKETDNSFTGMIMGNRKVSDKPIETGLFGYSNGIQSFFLNAEDGSATFGRADNGQIIIDPSKTEAKIYGGNYEEKDEENNGSGMLINLTTPEIRWGNGKFLLDEEGNLTAYGKIHVEQDGSIGGWSIDNDAIVSKEGILKLNADGSIIGPKMDSGTLVWEITKEGKATFTDITIINSNTKNTLYWGENGNFQVNEAGIITAKGAILEGNLQAGTIGSGWEIDSKQIRSIKKININEKEESLLALQAGDDEKNTFIIAPNRFQLGGASVDGTLLGARFIGKVEIYGDCQIGDPNSDKAYSVIANKIDIKSGQVGSFTIKEDGTLFGGGEQKTDSIIKFYPKGANLKADNQITYTCFIVVYTPHIDGDSVSYYNFQAISTSGLISGTATLIL